MKKEEVEEEAEEEEEEGEEGEEEEVEEEGEEEEEEEEEVEEEEEEMNSKQTNKSSKLVNKKRNWPKRTNQRRNEEENDNLMMIVVITIIIIVMSVLNIIFIDIFLYHLRENVNNKSNFYYFEIFFCLILAIKFCLKYKTIIINTFSCYFHHREIIFLSYFQQKHHYRIHLHSPLNLHQPSDWD